MLKELESLSKKDFKELKDFKGVIVNISIEERQFDEKQEKKSVYKLEIENKELNYKRNKFIVIYDAEFLKSMNGRTTSLAKFINKYDSIPKVGMTIDMKFKDNKEEINYN